MPCRLEATSERVVELELLKNNIELVSFRSFKRAAKSGQYDNMYLTFLATQQQEQHVNFTHRSSHGELGHGDTTTLTSEAKNMLGELKRTHSKVFTEPTYPVRRPT